MKKKGMEEFDYNDKIIEDLKLSELQVLNIISEWYTNGMTSEIINCENGENSVELDEFVNNEFWEKYDEIKLIEDSKSLL